LSDPYIDNENLNELSFSPTHWTIENLRLRDEPDTAANVLLTLQKGTAVQKIGIGRIQNIDGITASWMHIQTADGERGWCFGGYLADVSSLILGIWADGENGTGWHFYYFTEEKALFGIFASGFFGVFNWSINENEIHFIGEIADHGERESVSSHIPFAVIDYNTIEIHETIFTRISEQDLISKYSSKDRLDELIENF